MIPDLLALTTIYGYPVVVLVGFLSSFTLFIPSPAFALIPVLGATLNPLLVGVLAGIGSALGELISYGLGRGINKIAKKQKEKLSGIKKLFQKYKPEVILFVFAATPLPFDLVGIFCGSIGFPAKKFFIPTLIGKIVKYLILAYAGFYGIQLIQYFID